jgi:hypothetical protein
MANEWNCPVNGNWADPTIDYSKPPWVAGVAVLTHEQVLFVQEKCEIVKAAYAPKIGEPAEPSDEYVQAEYNKLVNFEQAVNGQTFAVIKSYDPTVNTLGIDENGIVQPEQPVTEEGAV